jgi:hypothetical protein
MNWRQMLMAVLMVVAVLAGMFGTNNAAKAKPYFECPVRGLCVHTMWRNSKATMTISPGLERRYDFYQFTWQRPGYQSAVMRMRGSGGSFMVSKAWRNTTYTFTVRGCVTKKIFFFKVGERCDNWHLFSTSSLDQN